MHLFSFALYEAYGTRPYEWGDDPDRQKANTKEEESDLGLLNEGMRYRDLETGTWLTRDPIGYGDGPNVYCYVHCNPIMSFDAFGLEEEDLGAEAIAQEIWDGNVNDLLYDDYFYGDVSGSLEFGNDLPSLSTSATTTGKESSELSVKVAGVKVGVANDGDGPKIALGANGVTIDSVGNYKVERGVEITAVKGGSGVKGELKSALVGGPNKDFALEVTESVALKVGAVKVEGKATLGAKIGKFVENCSNALITIFEIGVFGSFEGGDEIYGEIKNSPTGGY